MGFSTQSDKPSAMQLNVMRIFLFVFAYIPLFMLNIFFVMSMLWAVWFQVDSRSWPRQMAVISDSSLEPIYGGTGIHAYEPLVSVSYTRGADFSHVKLRGEYEEIKCYGDLACSQRYMNQKYPVGSPIQIMINPGHDHAPYNVDEPFPWWWFSRTVLIVLVTIYFVRKMRALFASATITP